MSGLARNLPFHQNTEQVVRDATGAPISGARLVGDDMTDSIEKMAARGLFMQASECKVLIS